ncbi:MAG: Tyrosine recombinase XerD [Syntrophorhabdus sp. PtaU1.Bin050]|nr:MAG: Tyrosine recombinase XerD [Syntrophorhabdus sp. PtaU1.Bin050]
MSIHWIKTPHKGLRYYEHPTRKHGKKKDRYYAIRFKVAGKDYSYGVGWLSEGVPDEIKKKHHDIGFEEHCLMLLRQYKGNLKAGTGPQSPKEKRRLEEERRNLEQAAKQEQERDSLTFDKIFTEYYYPNALRTKANRSATREEQFFRLWLSPVIGSLTLKDIASSELHLQKIRRNMAEGKRANEQIKPNKRTEKARSEERPASERSINYCMAVLRQIFNYARRSGLFDGNNPVQGIKERKLDNKRFRFLTHEEAEQLLETLKLRSLDVHDMCLLSLDCGLRAGEVFKLTWGDVDTDKGMMVLRDTKSGQTRFGYMTTRVKDMLSRRIAGERNQLVFPGEDGKPAQRITNTFFDTVNQLGFNRGVTDVRQKVVFHTLRHTYASWLVQNGVNLYTVQKLLGHSTISQTERYSHLAPSTLQDAIRVLERAMEQAKADNVIELRK